jgi:hypothetical protein
VDLILLDWTRMGRAYCLAGAVLQDGQLRVVRPLLAALRDTAPRNVGWPARLIDGHARWEVFALERAEPAEPEPPHLEDVWVHALRPRRLLAPPDYRRAILQATAAPPDAEVFGAPLNCPRSAPCLVPHAGERSLATVLLPAGQIAFSAGLREGKSRPDYRVTLALPGLGPVGLPVKDHHLLCRAEAAAERLDDRAEVLTQLVRQMGPTTAVRLGLSRPYRGPDDPGPEACWLMANGFFSLDDPQS